MTEWWGSVYRGGWGGGDGGLIQEEGWRFIWRVPAYMTTPSAEGRLFTSSVVFPFLRLFSPSPDVSLPCPHLHLRPPALLFHPSIPLS